MPTSEIPVDTQDARSEALSKERREALALMKAAAAIRPGTRHTVARLLRRGGRIAGEGVLPIVAPPAADPCLDGTSDAALSDVSEDAPAAVDEASFVLVALASPAVVVCVVLATRSKPLDHGQLPGHEGDAAQGKGT